MGLSSSIQSYIRLPSGRHLATIALMITLSACDTKTPNAATPPSSVIVPDSVASHTAIEDDTARAMRTIFGSPTGGAITIRDKDIYYSKGRIIALSTGSVLIAAGDVAGSAHPDPGSVGIWYVEKFGETWKVRGAYPDFVSVGTFGSAPEWRIRNDLGKYPVLEVDAFGMWFGHAYTHATLVQLRPAKPKLLVADVLTSYEFDPGDDPAIVEPASSIQGVIEYSGERDLFTVRYSGTVKATQIYRLRAGRYLPTKRLPKLENL